MEGPGDPSGAEDPLLSIDIDTPAELRTACTPALSPFNPSEERKDALKAQCTTVGSQLLWTLPSQNHSPRFLMSHDPSISADLPSSCPAPRKRDS